MITLAVFKRYQKLFELVEEVNKLYHFLTLKDFHRLIQQKFSPWVDNFIPFSIIATNSTLHKDQRFIRLTVNSNLLEEFNMYKHLDEEHPNEYLVKINDFFPKVIEKVDILSRLWNDHYINGDIISMKMKQDIEKAKKLYSINFVDSF